MPLTREPRNQNIYTDEVDQKGGYTAKVRDKEARAAAKEAAETAKADLDAYKETNDAAVADLDDRLDQAELDIGAAEGAIDELEDALDVLILVQDTQPTSPDNKIWIKETDTPIVIPEMSDIADFVSFSEDQTSRTDAEKAQARANINAEKSWVKLWENANPSSAFASQTLSFDLSKYTHIGIRFAQYWNTQTNFAIFKIGESGALRSVVQYNCTRSVSVSATGVNFGGGNTWNTYSNGNTTANNGMCVPKEIFGLVLG